MTAWQKGALTVFVLSVGMSSLFTVVGMNAAARYAIVPATVMSAWAFLGHLVTLDDDAPGGWANPDGLPEVWSASRKGLADKLIVFLVVGSAAVWLWTR